VLRNEKLQDCRADQRPDDACVGLTMTGASEGRA